MAIKVKLRQKKISKGRKSLYLDFYPPIPHSETGEPTRREFLGLYIFEKPKTPIDKQHNKETLEIANSIRQKRENYLNKPEIYSEFELEQRRIKELGEICFVEYFSKLANKRKASNHDNWMSALNYLKSYTGESIKFKNLNESFCEDFKEYLLTTKNNRRKTALSNNSAVSYFNKIKAALKQAYKDGILQEDLNAKVEPIKATETRREYLTIGELNKLVKTPCNDPLLKNAALFSALTGLRFSDIQKMIWKELEYVDGQGYFINFSQKKTKGVEVLPISNQAYSLTEGANNPKDMPQDKPVFEGLKYSAYHNKHLFQWIGAAGITKDITFHCFRHTFAVLQLMPKSDGTPGTDIYTVSKMLGHRDLKTTQIYAKIVDKAKRTAANKIKLDLQELDSTIEK
jgi:integrase